MTILRFSIRRADARATDQAAAAAVAAGATAPAARRSTAAIIVVLGGTMAIVVHGGTASRLRLGLHQVQGALEVVVGVLELQALLCPTRVGFAERIRRCPSRDGKEIMETESSRVGPTTSNRLRLLAAEKGVDGASPRGGNDSRWGVLAA